MNSNHIIDQITEHTNNLSILAVKADKTYEDLIMIESLESWIDDLEHELLTCLEYEE